MEGDQVFDLLIGAIVVLGEDDRNPLVPRGCGNVVGTVVGVEDDGRQVGIDRVERRSPGR